ncbi:hypothetical protein AALO_G00254210 [Alosa alosa]|uniref:Uncharacterized protein n=1 Tax=Alosa alosa TaxID=278164 RepID=A0AAV6FP20_9TELE|nr:hypothetical protein AALO_G00254210 [Alosa alosa]
MSVMVRCVHLPPWRLARCTANGIHRLDVHRRVRNFITVQSEYRLVTGQKGLARCETLLVMRSCSHSANWQVPRCVWRLLSGGRCAGEASSCGQWG